jgi:hypothetical protein
MATTHCSLPTEGRSKLIAWDMTAHFDYTDHMQHTDVQTHHTQVSQGIALISRQSNLHEDPHVL